MPQLSANLPYPLVGNNPLSGIDPSGYEATDEDLDEVSEVGMDDLERLGPSDLGIADVDSPHTYRMFATPLPGNGSDGGVQVETMDGTVSTESQSGAQEAGSRTSRVIGFGKGWIKDIAHGAHNYITGVSPEDQGDPMRLEPVNLDELAGASLYFDHALELNIATFVAG